MADKNIWTVPVDVRSGAIDAAEVRRALALFVDPDATHQVQALPSGRFKIVRGNDLDAAVEAVKELADEKGLYVMMNPARPGQTKAVRAGDVVERRRILIDCDRTRNKDLNASEEEKEAARLVLTAVSDYLQSLGWPKPIVIDSGNGWHLIFSVDLPADKLSHQTVKKCLKVLQSMFGTDAAEVDVKVHNANRITKLPGTWVRKGPHSADRPHRMARLVSVPTAFTPVSFEQLQALTDGGDKEPEAARTAGPDWTVTVPGPGPGGKDAYLRRAVDLECEAVAGAREGQRNDRLNVAAFNLGQLLGHGLDRRSLETELEYAAKKAGLGETESTGTIRSGLDAGAAQPRVIEEKPRPKSGAATPATLPPAGERITVRASEIKPKVVRWLWQDRVAIGFITMFAGRTGLGKSFVTCDFAARLTQGEDLPDGPSGLHGEPSGVLFISEDPYEYVLAPRLLELNADLTRVTFLKWEYMANYILSDTAFLDRAFEEADRPVLVVIDPPTNFLGDGVDEHKNAAVRSLLMHVVQWIKDKDAACVMITHVNKSTGKGTEAINRVIGSVAWTTTARIVHAFAPDPDRPGDCIFVPTKNNLGPTGKALGYRIRKTDSLATVEWLGEIDTTADAAMAGETKKPRGIVAVEWLAEMFANRSEWPSDEIKQAAKEAGISHNALFAPEVNALPIKKRPHVGADGNRFWVWKAEPGWPPPK